jgi:hypothetical protein
MVAGVIAARSDSAVEMFKYPSRNRPRAANWRAADQPGIGAKCLHGDPGRVVFQTSSSQLAWTRAWPPLTAPKSQGGPEAQVLLDRSVAPSQTGRLIA